jgi:hypothetical protein
LIQHVRVDVGAVGPRDGAGSRLDRHLAESRRIGPEGFEDRPLEILLQIDLLGGPVGELEIDGETRERSDGANPHEAFHSSI